MDITALCERIIGCAFHIHNHFGLGFPEKVYENALAVELQNFEGISIKQQHPIPVYYRGIKVGEYFADLLVENIIIVELKSALQIGKEHEAQLVHSVQATGIDHGLLINFGASVSVKHKYGK
jgi:GxxExxY protein